MPNKNECDPYAPVPGFTEESLLTDADIAFMQENQDFMLGRQKRRECDHVVGVSSTTYRSILEVSMQEVSDYNKARLMNTGMPLKVIHMKFSYCPNCGAKINWKKIKEDCDANTDN